MCITHTGTSLQPWRPQQMQPSLIIWLWKGEVGEYWGGEGRGRGCLPTTLPPQLFPCQGLPEWLGSDQASAKERTHFIAQQAAFPHRWTSHIKSLGALTCKENPPPLATADPQTCPYACGYPISHVKTPCGVLEDGQA